MPRRLEKNPDLQKEMTLHTRLLFLSLSCISAVLVLINSIKYGPGVTHDSVAYIHAAKSLIAGNGLAYFGYPSPFIQWPPLYPFLLALTGALHIPVLAAAIAINTLSFGGIVYLSGVWLYRHAQTKHFAFLGATAIMLSPQMHFISRFLWTETLFILLSFLFFIFFEAFLYHGKHKDLLLSALFAALACLNRYTGIALILTGCLFLIFYNYMKNDQDNDKKKWWPRIINVLIFGSLSAFPTVLYLVRNYIVSATFAGLRPAAQVTFFTNIKRTIQTFLSWFLSGDFIHIDLFSSLIKVNIFYTLATVLSLLALMLLTFILLIAFIQILKNRKSSHKHNVVPIKSSPPYRKSSHKHNVLPIKSSPPYRKSSHKHNVLPIKSSPPSNALSPQQPRAEHISASVKTNIRSYGPIFAYIIIFTAQLISSATKVAFDPIGDRYLSPAYVPLFLLSFIILDVTASYFSDQKHMSALISALLVIWLLFPLAATTNQLNTSVRTGAGGLQTDQWKNNTIIQYLNKEKPIGQVYSNNASAVYFLADRSAFSTPKYKGPDMYRLPWFEKEIATNPDAWLVWFGSAESDAVYGPRALAALYELEPVKTFNEGTIYHIGSRK